MGNDDDNGNNVDDDDDDDDDDNSYFDISEFILRVVVDLTFLPAGAKAVASF